MADKDIRYVDGGHVAGSGGRCRWVHAYVGFRLCGTYKGYTRKVEDASMTLYPFTISDPELVPGKHVVSVFDIKSR